MSRKYGYLSELQFKVLQLRVEKGLSQVEVARKLGTTRENITIIERRAKRNIKLAEETVQAYKRLLCAAQVRVEAGMHLADVPGMVIKTSDNIGVKLKANFTRIYDEIRFKVGDCIAGTRVAKPFFVAILRNGDIEVTYAA